MSWLENQNSFKKIFIALVAVYAVVILTNDGFMGTDEYWTGITRYIPAQTASIQNLVTIEDVKSPLQILPMHLIAQSALAAGVQHPYWQYRIVVFIIGLISCFVLVWTFHQCFASGSPSEQLTARKKIARRNMAFLLLAFYCAAPFAFTRPMFESMAAPWLGLSAVWAYLYDQSNKKSFLIGAVIAICISFMLRQQTGICALALLLVPLLKKNWRDLILASSLGLAIFIILGVPDVFLRGDFHYSLKAVLFYNVSHGSEYGQQSILTYPLLLVAMSFLPLLIKKYPPGFFLNEFKHFRVFWFYIISFTLLHSLFPQKFERFLISIIPHVLILMVPFLTEIFLSAKKHSLRIALILGFNFILFIPASFFPAQKNLIDASLYFDTHPEIQRVYRLHDVPEWITDAFIRQKNYQFINLPEENLPHLILQQNEYLILNEFDYSKLKSQLKQFKEVTRFEVNLIEKFAYRFNPDKNVRRSPLILLK